MLADQPTSAQTQEARVKPLRWLEAELRMYGLATVLVPDPMRAYLRVVHGAATETVWLDTHDGHRCYRWGEPPATTHPLFDPAGAARRIATGLRRERRVTEGSPRRV